MCIAIKKNHQLFYIISILFCITSLNAFAETYTIGVLAFEGKEQAISRWSPTADYLTKKIPQHRFKIVPMTHQEIEYSLVKKQINFIVTNPGHYVQLETVFSASRIATFVSQQNNAKLNKFSSVIFTRSDSNITNLNDLKGKTIAAVSQNAFGGFQIIQDMMLTKGIDILSDMIPMWVGFPQTDIVNVVMSGKAEAGIVRSGILEKLIVSKQLDINKIRIINKQNKKSFPLLYSANLVPEWPFAKLAHTQDKTAKQVAVALMQMPVTHNAAIKSGGAGWTIPVDYTQVHDILKHLKVPPYTPKALSKTQLLNDYGFWLLGFSLFSLLTFMLLAYYSRANKKLHSSYEELSEKEKALEETVLKRTEELNKTNKNLNTELLHLKSADLCIARCSETLNELYQIFSRVDLSFPQKLQSLIEVIKRHMGVEICVVSVVVDKKYQTRAASPENIKHELPLSQEGAALAIEKKEMVVLEHHADWRSYLALPIFDKNELHCLFEFASPKMSQDDSKVVDNQSPELRNQLLQLVSLWISKELTSFDSEQHSSHVDNVIKERFNALTNREKEVLQLLVQGDSSKEIAKRLELSPRTIEMHRANLVQKTGVKSSSELIQLAVLSKEFL